MKLYAFWKDTEIDSFDVDEEALRRGAAYVSMRLPDRLHSAALARQELVIVDNRGVTYRFDVDFEHFVDDGPVDLRCVNGYVYPSSPWESADTTS